jgi:hypothetical protein
MNDQEVLPPRQDEQDPSAEVAGVSQPEIKADDWKNYYQKSPASQTTAEQQIETPQAAEASVGMLPGRTVLPAERPQNPSRLQRVGGRIASLFSRRRENSAEPTAPAASISPAVERVARSADLGTPAPVGETPTLFSSDIKEPVNFRKAVRAETLPQEGIDEVAPVGAVASLPAQQTTASGLSRRSRSKPADVISEQTASIDVGPSADQLAAIAQSRTSR